MVVIPGREQSPRARNLGTPAYQASRKAGVHGFRACPSGAPRNDGQAEGASDRRLSRADCSDRVELPGDIVRNSPEIADIGLADECVGAALMPPVKQVDVLSASQGG